MKRNLLLSASVLLLFALSTPPTAQAQFQIGPHLGFNLDGSDLLVGANAKFPVNIGEYALIGNPGVDFYFFDEDVTTARFNIDVLYPFSRAQSFAPYVGAGLLIQYTSFDLPDNAPRGLESTDTDIGLNFKIGTSFSAGDAPFLPFVEGHFAVKNNSDFAIRAGILFPMN